MNLETIAAGMLAGVQAPDGQEERAFYRAQLAEICALILQARVERVWRDDVMDEAQGLAYQMIKAGLEDALPEWAENDAHLMKRLNLS